MLKRVREVSQISFLLCRARTNSRNLHTEKTGVEKRKPVPIQIIEEDEDFFFINKPPNVSLETNQYFHQSIKEYGKAKHDFEPRVLFPLEKISSGIAVFAKTATAERHFFKSYSFGSKDNFVLRFYSAVTTIRDSQKLSGKPNGQVLGGLLNSTKGGNKVVFVKKGGSAAITKYQTVGNTSTNALVKADYKSKAVPANISVSLLCLTPVTLRSYQMRATCFFLDAPIMGDKRYSSNVETPNRRVYLHLGYMSFPSRQVNKCYQVRSVPEWENDLFKETISVHTQGHPKATRTNNFLASKKPKK